MKVCQSRSVTASLIMLSEGEQATLRVGIGPTLQFSFPYIPKLWTKVKTWFFPPKPNTGVWGLCWLVSYMGHIQSSDWSRAGYLFCMGDRLRGSSPESPLTLDLHLCILPHRGRVRSVPHTFPTCQQEEVGQVAQGRGRVLQWWDGVMIRVW